MMMSAKFKQLNIKENPTAASASSAAPPWTELPSDLTANILQRLGTVEILESAQKVCATWWKICQNPDMWRVIKIVNPEDSIGSEEEEVEEYLTVMCRRAVDRSQGRLIDLTLSCFGNKELLRYIADGSRQLRSLTLASCYDISSTALIEAAKKLPKLEELHLYMIPRLSGKDIEIIGSCCPMLKSFTFNQTRCLVSTPAGNDEQAVAIANSMPNLHQLGLLANELKNEGLQAILDGCPYLESLDLRVCKALDLGGELGIRCREQVKDLRLPSDSFVHDYEWDDYHRMDDLYCDDDARYGDSDGEHCYNYGGW